MKTVTYSTHSGFGISDYVVNADNVLEVIQTGICGSDRHMVINPTVHVQNVGIGHEIIGRVYKLDKPEQLLGDPVRIGDRVIVVPGINCGQCSNCLIERRYCSDRFVYGFSEPEDGKPIPGGFSEFLPLLPHTKVFRVPESLSNDRAVFIEIMACAVGAVEKIMEVMDPSRIRRILIVGAGSAGVACYAASRALSVEVDLVESENEQRKFAAGIGIQTLHSVDEGQERYSAVIDCAGTARSFALGIDVLKRGGCLVEFGAYFPTQPVENFAFWEICQKELTVRGLSETQDRFFLRAIRILEEVREVRFEEFVRARINLRDIDSLRSALTTPGVGKIVVIPS